MTTFEGVQDVQIVTIRPDCFMSLYIGPTILVIVIGQRIVNRLDKIISLLEKK